MKHDKPFFWRNLPSKLSTSGGRFKLLFSTLNRSWPVLSRAVNLYRRTLICRSRIAAVMGCFGKTTTTRAAMTALSGDVNRLFEFNVGSSLSVVLFRIRPWNRYSAMEVALGPGSNASVRKNDSAGYCRGDLHRKRA